MKLGDFTQNGRIKGHISPLAQRAISYHSGATRKRDELAAIAEIDSAHIVMLVRSGFISEQNAMAILEVISSLKADDFRQLVEVEHPRGIYFLYEDYIITTLGAKIAGNIHIGRSRNDLNATSARLRLRPQINNFVKELTRFIISLLVRAKRYQSSLMPLYTHLQPAQPSSYGHYLLAIAQASLRSLGAVIHEVRYGSIGSLPLGAGAGAGTTLSIDPHMTMGLLGFRDLALNSIDAVATRDFAMRLTNEMTVISTLLSRFAADMQIWTSKEFNFFNLPDSLVGSSSMMPQKRNAYLLEHIQGKAALISGQMQAIITAAHGKPYTNNIASNTIGIFEAENSLDTIIDILLLSRIMLRGAVPNIAAMRHRCEGSFIDATYIADRLAIRGMPFRSAHNLVGSSISQLLENDENQATSCLIDLIREQVDWDDGEIIDMEKILEESSKGGGPGSAPAVIELSVHSLREFHASFAEVKTLWKNSADVLLREIVKISFSK